MVCLMVCAALVGAAWYRGIVPDFTCIFNARPRTYRLWDGAVGPQDGVAGAILASVVAVTVPIRRSRYRIVDRICGRC